MWRKMFPYWLYYLYRPASLRWVPILFVQIALISMLSGVQSIRCVPIRHTRKPSNNPQSPFQTSEIVETRRTSPVWLLHATDDSCHHSSANSIGARPPGSGRPPQNCSSCPWMGLQCEGERHGLIAPAGTNILSRQTDCSACRKYGGLRQGRVQFLSKSEQPAGLNRKTSIDFR